MQWLWLLYPKGTGLLSRVLGVVIRFIAVVLVLMVIALVVALVEYRLTLTLLLA
jgi:hypothetical protein